MKIRNIIVVSQNKAIYKSSQPGTLHWVCSYVKVTNATCLCRSLVSFYEALPSDYGAYLDC